MEESGERSSVEHRFSPPQKPHASPPHRRRLRHLRRRRYRVRTWLRSLDHAQTNLAKRGVRGVIIGHLNCKRYPDFCVGEQGGLEASIDSTCRATPRCSFITRGRAKTSRFLSRRSCHCCHCGTTWRIRWTIFMEVGCNTSCLLDTE